MLCSFGTKIRGSHVTTTWRMLKLRMEERPPTWRVASNIMNKPSRTAEKGWSSSLGLEKVLTNLHRKKWSCYKTNNVPWVKTDPLVQTKQWKRNMRFGTRSVESL
jgi:hypothetical protein